MQSSRKLWSREQTVNRSKLRGFSDIAIIKLDNCDKNAEGASKKCEKQAWKEWNFQRRHINVEKRENFRIEYDMTTHRRKDH